MQRAFPSLVFIALATASLAGCLGGETSTAYHSFASKGSFVSGFAYDGKGVQPFAGDAAIDVDEAKNTGLLVAKGSVDGQEFKITFDRFSEAPGKPFQNGGLAADFHEHGASGVGDRSIPEVDIAMAGWGKAKITLAGQPYIEPITGSPDWLAHFMVIRNGVRNDTTGGIYQDANNAKVYDPATGLGHSTPSDWELHLVLRNATPAKAPTPTTILASDTTPSPTYSVTKPLVTVNAVGSLAEYNFTLNGVAEVKVTILDPTGKTVGTPRDVSNLKPTPVQSQKVRGSFVAEKIGEYRVKVEGTVGAQASWEVRGELKPPPSVLYNLWWEDLIFGEEAEKKIDQTGLIPHTEHGGNATKRV